MRLLVCRVNLGKENAERERGSAWRRTTTVLTERLVVVVVVVVVGGGCQVEKREDGEVGADTREMLL